jgi:hypothetical protein
VGHQRKAFALLQINTDLLHPGTETLRLITHITSNFFDCFWQLNAFRPSPNKWLYLDTELNPGFRDEDKIKTKGKYNVTIKIAKKQTITGLSARKNFVWHSVRIFRTAVTRVSETSLTALNKGDCIGENFLNLKSHWKHFFKETSLRLVQSLTCE